MFNAAVYQIVRVREQLSDTGMVRPSFLSNVHRLSWQDQQNVVGLNYHIFAERTNGRDYATVFCLSVVCLSVRNVLRACG